MPHFISVRDMVVKRRPKAYKSDGMTVGGNAGMYLASRPRPYPKTAQQRKVANAAHDCGIKTGISRAALRKAMVDCVGEKMRKG